LNKHRFHNSFFLYFLKFKHIWFPLRGLWLVIYSSYWGVFSCMYSRRNEKDCSVFSRTFVCVLIYIDIYFHYSVVIKLIRVYIPIILWALRRWLCRNVGRCRFFAMVWRKRGFTIHVNNRWFLLNL
jgi:hypothetical protein